MRILWALARLVMRRRQERDMRSPRYVKNHLPETFTELQRRAREEWEPASVLDAEEAAGRQP